MNIHSYMLINSKIIKIIICTFFDRFHCYNILRQI